MKAQSLNGKVVNLHNSFGSWDPHLHPLPTKGTRPPQSLEPEGYPPGYYTQVTEESLATHTISGQVPRPTSKQWPEGKMLHMLSPIPSPTENEWRPLLFMKGHSSTSHDPFSVRYTTHFNLRNANDCKLSNIKASLHLFTWPSLKVLKYKDFFLSPTRIKENPTCSRMKRPKATAWVSILLEAICWWLPKESFS